MRYVILLSGVDTDPARTLFEALRHAGVCVVVVAPEGAGEEEEAERARAGWGEEPLAVLFDLAADAALPELHERAGRAAKVWPGVPLVACRREAAADAGRGAGALNEATLKRLGFHAVAAGPAQIFALLRDVEEHGTGDGSAGDGDSAPGATPASLLLPERLSAERLRAAFEVVASLHLAADQRGAAQAALAGLAALVAADRWTVYLCGESGGLTDAPFEPLAVRGLTESERAISEEDWRRALMGDALALAGSESKAAREAAHTAETVSRKEGGRRALALRRGAALGAGAARRGGALELRARGRGRAPLADRRPDEAPQCALPAPVPRQRAEARAPLRVAGDGLLPRPRRLQAGQRPLRPPRRLARPDGDGRGHPRLRARHGRGGALRRRRVRRRPPRDRP